MIKSCENREIRKVKKKKKKRYERFFRKTKKNIKFRFKISKFFVYSITVYIQAPPESRMDRNGRANFTSRRSKTEKNWKKVRQIN